MKEVQRILALLPQNGLIVDVRGNGGGVIAAGELLLQLFTPRTIEPEHLHFINTPMTLEVATRPGFEPWHDSIAEAVETATPFSDGLPLAPRYAELCNLFGQRYYGPVALIIDALCYSTTDIFAAGFQDHEIGPVIGTSGNTGAGGANVWTYDDVLEALPDSLRAAAQACLDARRDPPDDARRRARRRPGRGPRRRAGHRRTALQARPARAQRRPDRQGRPACSCSARGAR